MLSIDAGEHNSYSKYNYLLEKANESSLKHAPTVVTVVVVIVGLGEDGRTSLAHGVA